MDHHQKADHAKEATDFLDAYRSVQCYLDARLSESRSKMDLLRKELTVLPPSKILCCNVGGVIYQTSFTTFDSVPNSLLYYTFHMARQDKVPRDANGNIFFDRCGYIFSHILNYLRNPTLEYLKLLIERNIYVKCFGKATIERLFQDMDFYRLDEMKRRTYWILELSGICESIHQKMKPHILHERHDDQDLGCLHVTKKPAGAQMGEYRFENGPGVNHCGTRFSQSTTVALFSGNWMPYESVIDDNDRNFPHATPFPGVYYVSISVLCAEGFGVGVLSPFHGSNCNLDFTRTKHCALYSGTQGIIHSNMCASMDWCENSDRNYQPSLPLESDSTQLLNAEKIQKGDTVGIKLNFTKSYIEWMLNCITVCYSPLCPRASKLRFAVVGKSKACVSL